MDYKDKIRKLLALAESPEEGEAKAALLKARQLMAEHKLREEDCRQPEKLKVIRKTIGVTCTKRKNAWLIFLSAIIARNYCCTSYRTRKANMQTTTIGFVGLEDDFEICEQVFRYAADCVFAGQKEIASRESGMCSGNELRCLLDAYGEGFCRGVREAFARQNRENQQYGLVLVVPKEVQDETSRFGKPTPFVRNQSNKVIGEFLYEMQGEKDGERFDPTHRLSAGKPAAVQQKGEK